MAVLLSEKKADLMRIITGDIFDMQHEGDAICITTNGSIKRNGHAVMGKDIALEANRRFVAVQGILDNDQYVMVRHPKP